VLQLGPELAYLEAGNGPALPQPENIISFLRGLLVQLDVKIKTSL